MTRYMHAHVGLIMQSTACNAVHNVEQRLAKWLLMGDERVGVNDFPLTQEFLAMMLGVTRPSVTIVDTEKLESASCECYRVVARLLASVIPPTAGRRRRR